MRRIVQLMAASMSLGCSLSIESSAATFSEPSPLARSEYAVRWKGVRQGDNFGMALVLHGDELIVGAPAADLQAPSADSSCVGPAPLTNAGRALSFAWEGGRWRLRGELDRGAASGGDGVVSISTFGQVANLPLARSGDLVALGVPSMDLSPCVSAVVPAAGLMNAGAVFLFERTQDGQWQRAAAPLLSSRPRAGELFGVSLTFHADRLYVGATGYDGDPGIARSGAVYVFERQGERWVESQVILPSRPIENGVFGNAVAADGDWLAVGAFLDSHGGRGVNPAASDEPRMSSGAVYVFERSDAQYVERAYLKAVNSDADDNFGLSLALQGETLLVGAPFEGGAHADLQPSDAARNAAEGAGAVYEYRLRGGEWEFESYLKAPLIRAAAGFGLALRLRGANLLATAPFEDGVATAGEGGLQDCGAAYLFARQGDAWRLTLAFRSSTPTPGALFGTAADFDERRVAIGAPEADALTGEVHTFALEHLQP